MTHRRFYASPDAFASDAASVTLSADEAKHLRNVLRLQPGDEAYVFDGDGHEFRGEIATISRDLAEIRIVQQVAPSAPESNLNLTMAVALLKGEKFDLVVQKLTELGVTSIIPIMTTRADVRIRSTEDADRKLVRWRRIVMEATKQCGRARLMTIESPVSLDAFITRSGVEDQLRLMLAERGGAPLNDSIGNRSQTVSALIGSEGGWTDDEITSARDAGWQIVTLPGRIMRAETAAIACAAILQHRFGDLI